MSESLSTLVLFGSSISTNGGRAPVSSLAFSVNYSFTKDLRLAFDATNLTNPSRAQYRYNEDEPQKIDTSGRQYYLSVRYKF
jgi:iron complex outermembrane recepter protein